MGRATSEKQRLQRQQTQHYGHCGGDYGQGHAKPNLPTHVIVNDCECLEKDSIILLGQIRILDKQRLQEYIGTFDRRLMMSVDKALAISIGISKKD